MYVRCLAARCPRDLLFILHLCSQDERFRPESLACTPQYPPLCERGIAALLVHLLSFVRDSTCLLQRVSLFSTFIDGPLPTMLIPQALKFLTHLTPFGINSHEVLAPDAPRIPTLAACQPDTLL